MSRFLLPPHPNLLCIIRDGHDKYVAIEGCAEGFLVWWRWESDLTSFARSDFDTEKDAILTFWEKVLTIWPEVSVMRAMGLSLEQIEAALKTLGALRSNEAA